ncbi:unnamed protein product [Phytophthora lilii]|uniref:Unnamed protein product n=1 Tax=Phytophthora lilii TaxID=2077276 RepID=A0A9W7D819_9STRA|nr:unnamed protein product [Phytophthora lilii]
MLNSVDTIAVLISKQPDCIVESHYAAFQQADVAQLRSKSAQKAFILQEWSSRNLIQSNYFTVPTNVLNTSVKGC